MKLARLAFFVFFLLAACAHRAPAAPDPHWSDRFATPGVNGSVRCAAPYRGGIAVGGLFTGVAGLPASNIAWWDGSRWQAFGAGTDGEVTSLIQIGDDLVITGRFTQAGGTIVHGAAVWRDGSWHAMGAGLQSSAQPVGALALAIFRDELYATGDFVASGQTPLHYVARWDGIAWRDVGGGIDTGSGTSFAVLNNRLYLGGGFRHAGGVPANGIARWDGVEWRALGNGTRRLGDAAPVLALAVYQSELAVGGDFDSAGTVAAKNVAIWNGTWRSLGDGHEGVVRALGWISGGLLVGPTYEAPSQLWNGIHWTDPALPWLGGTAFGYLYQGGLVTYGDVVGSDGSIGLVRQQGDTWQGFGMFNDRTNGLVPWSVVEALVRVPGGILAGGVFDRVGSPEGWVTTDRLARWDGARWHALPPIPGYGGIGAILVHGDTIDVGGSFHVYGNPVTPVLRLAGSSWTCLGALSIEVNDMRMYQGSLIVGGGQLGVDGPDPGGAYRWDGREWISIGTFVDRSPYERVHAMEELDGRLVVAGGFDSVDGVAANSIAVWNGTSWAPLGAGPGRYNDTNAVYDLVHYRGRLVASGEFQNGGPGFASWDGAQWTPLGNAPRSGLAMSVSGDELFASAAEYYGLVVSAWDGTSWRELGTTSGGMVYALSADDNGVYVGGVFMGFGEQASVGFARWNGLDVPPWRTTLSSGWPNPFRESITLQYQVRAPGSLRLLVRDVNGRKVRTIESAALSAGTGQVPWDGRDDAGRRAPAGVYFVTLLTEGGDHDSRKVVLLP